MFLPFRQPEHKKHTLPLALRTRFQVRPHLPLHRIGHAVSARVSAPKKIWRFRPTFSVLSDWQPLLLGFSNLAKYQGRPCF